MQEQCNHLAKIILVTLIFDHFCKKYNILVPYPQQLALFVAIMAQQDLQQTAKYEKVRGKCPSLFAEDKQLTCHVIEYDHQNTRQQFNDIAISGQAIYQHENNGRFQQAGTDTAANKFCQLR